MFLRALVLFLVGLVSFAFACASLREAEAPAVVLSACVASALVPVAGTYERAEDLARDVQAQRVSVEDALLAAHATVEESAKVYADLRACSDAFKAALADAGAGGSWGGASTDDAGVAP